MKVGGQPGGVRQPQPVFHRGEDFLQHGVVPFCADEVLGDLPGVADVRVGQRLLAPAEPGRLTEAGQLAGPRRSHRELNRPEALDLQAQVVCPRREFDAERGLLIAAQCPSTAAALAVVTCGNGGWVIWGIRGSRLAIKCV